MQVLEDYLAKKREELRKLQIEIATAEELLRRSAGPTGPVPLKKRAPRSNVKNLVLNLLEEAGEAGLVATSAVEMAEKRGEHLERGTVSSLLSRLKHDQIVRYDGNAYRLSKFENVVEVGTKPEATVHSFPASKIAP